MDPDQHPEVIYKIMTESSLSRSDRLNMLGLMKRYDKLTLQPCGPEKLSPLIYCLKLRRLYLMKFFTDIPRIEQRTYYYIKLIYFNASKVDVDAIH